VNNSLGRTSSFCESRVKAELVGVLSFCKRQIRKRGPYGRTEAQPTVRLSANGTRLYSAPVQKITVLHIQIASRRTNNRTLMKDKNLHFHACKLTNYVNGRKTVKNCFIGGHYRTLCRRTIVKITSAKLLSIIKYFLGYAVR
jgi:hypothetical protein